MSNTCRILLTLLPATLLPACGCHNATPPQTPPTTQTKPDLTQPAPDSAEPNDPGTGRNPLINWLARLLPDSPREKQRNITTLLLSEDADLRRQGILTLADKQPASWKSTPKILANRALGDPDPQVRAAAVQVYAKITPPGEDASELLTQTAQDRDRLVRCETIIALTDRTDPASQKTLLLLLEHDPEPALRALVAQALANFPDKQVVRALIAVLDDDSFPLAYRARESLKILTAQDFAYDSAAWNQWYFAADHVLAPTPIKNQVMPLNNKR